MKVELNKLAISIALVLAGFALSASSTAAQDKTVRLTVSQRPSGGLKAEHITSRPDGIDGLCVSSCSKEFPAGTVVSITVDASKSSRWEGGCATTHGATCEVKMDSDKTIVLVERQSQNATLTSRLKSINNGFLGYLIAQPGGKELSSNGQKVIFPLGTTVTITQNHPGAGKFERWEGACAGQQVSPPRCTLVMNDDKEVLSVWTDQHPTSGDMTLTIRAVGTTADTFRLLPPSKYRSSCSGGCIEHYAKDAEVTIEAYSSVHGTEFDHWEGCSSSSRFTCRVRMTKSHSVTAFFTKN